MGRGNGLSVFQFRDGREGGNISGIWRSCVFAQDEKGELASRAAEAAGRIH